MFKTISRGTALLLCLTALGLPAQTSRNKEKEREARERELERRNETREREIERRAERLAESISRTVETSVENAMRQAESALAKVDKHYYQGSGSRSQQSQERIDTSFTFSRDGVLDLTTFSGNVVVTGSSRQEARIRGLTERGTRWRVSSSRITIEAEGYRGRAGDAGYEITVPEGVRVIINSMNGDIAVRGVKGEVDLHTNNGDVEVTDAVGRVEMATLSGDVTGTRLRGAVDATTLNGTLTLTDVQGPSIAAENTSGSVEVLNATSPDIELSSVSGEVDFSGPLDPKGRYSFSSHSGTVTLTIPASTSARFTVETFNGEVDSDFPFTLQPNPKNGGRQGQKLEFNVGAGEARVTAESFSGGIVIRRATNRR